MIPLTKTKMSKLLNGLKNYDKIREGEDEDYRRSLLFNHLETSTAAYLIGCEMQTILRLQLEYGLEAELFEVMYDKAVMVSKLRNNIKTEMSFMETKQLVSCLKEITSLLDKKSENYKKNVFKRKRKHRRCTDFRRDESPRSEPTFLRSDVYRNLVYSSPNR